MTRADFTKKPVTLCELMRRSVGASSMDVAKLAGVSRNTIERIEKGERISDRTAQLVAIALGYTGRPGDVTKAIIWGGSGNPRLERKQASEVIE